jgi:hypothetical protein
MSEPGLAIAIVVGILLVAGSVWMRRRGDATISPSDIALGMAPFVVWLLVSGQITKLGFAGVEIEVRQAILNAASKSVEGQVTAVEGVVDSVEASVDRLSAADRGAKGRESMLPVLVKRRIEALEFHFGRGNYYVGSVIRNYFDTLVPLPFFRYILLFDEQKRLAGMFDKQELAHGLDQKDDGYDWFAQVVNQGGQVATQALAELPGYIPGSAAIAPTADKRTALARMEKIGSAILPVVDPDTGQLVGVVERSRLTATLILDIAGRLEEAN